MIEKGALHAFYETFEPVKIPVSFGFGVNTGLATVGNVGAKGRLQNYTAIGDVINVAARLQSNVTDNEIFLNAPTCEKVHQLVRIGPRRIRLQVSPHNMRPR